MLIFHFIKQGICLKGVHYGKMLKQIKRSFVSIIIKNRWGFTLISTLLAITIISLTLPLLTPIIKAVSYQTTYYLTSTEHFFFFIYQKILQSDYFYVKNNRLYFKNKNGQLIKIEKYGSVVRRQVDRKGHEIYLRDVENFTIKQLDHHIFIEVHLKSGEVYEKTFINFKQ